MADTHTDSPEPRRTLGDRYVLGEAVGSGGMGTVWQASDEWTGERVAVKLIHDERAKRARARRLFGREIRAVVRMDHPGVVRVFDYGVDYQGGDHGELFFVMEYVDGPTLGALDTARLRWLDVVDVFEQVLATLAYAHARGVVHRDVKPDNFLVALEGDLPRLKLVDFGIAKLWGEVEQVEADQPRTTDEIERASGDFTISDSTVGTPAYMAPELGRGLHHLVGPATDLYAVGCMLYEFIAGNRPFKGESAMTRILAHITGSIPTLTCRDGRPVPEALRSLVVDLLDKDPRTRPCCAADVLERLRAVPDFDLLAPEGDGGERGLASLLSELSDARSDATLVDESADTIGMVTPPPPRSDTPEPIVEPSTVPPPESNGGFRTSRLQSPFQSTAARLGLVAIRQPELVGRLDEQAWLVERVESTLGDGQARLSLLTGESGVGKRRLAREVGQALVEQGRARVLTLQPGAQNGRGGVRAALRRAIGVAETTEDALAAELREHPRLGDVAGLPAGVGAVARLLSEPVAAAEPLDYIELGAVLAVLELYRRDKPLVLVIENLDEAPSDRLFALLANLVQLGRRTPFPLALIATAGGDDHRLDALRDLGSVASLRLEPLGGDESVRLMRSLLPIRTSAARRIVAYGGGLPHRLIQLIHALGQRGLLYSSSGEFWLRPGAEEVLQDERDDERWQARLAQVSDDGPLGPRRVGVLQVAAMLGREPDLEVLADALARCEALERDGVDEAVDFWIRQGLLIETDAGGARFEHRLIHHQLRQNAEAAPAAARRHLALAEAMLERVDRADAGRIGDHLLAAGDERALTFLMAGASQALDLGQYLRASRLYRRAEDAADRMGVDRSDERRVAIAAGSGRAALRTGDEARLQAAMAALQDHRPGSPGRAWYDWLDGERALRRGDLARAQACSRRAADGFEALELTLALLRARETLANAARKAGRYAEAEAQAAAALRLARHAEQPITAARLTNLLGFIMLETERYADALERADQALALVDQGHNRFEQAHALKVRCGALLRLVRLDEAVDAGRRALSIFRDVGDGVGEVAILNILAMCHHEAGRFGLARQLGRESLERSHDIGERSLRGRILNNLANACEELGRLHEADQHYAQALFWSHRTGDRQNEARVCFNLARRRRADRPAEALVWARRARAILEALGLPYVRSCDELILQLNTRLGAQRATAIAAEDALHLGRLYADCGVEGLDH